jgi:hypothetical protein
LSKTEKSSPARFPLIDFPLLISTAIARFSCCNVRNEQHALFTLNEGFAFKAWQVLDSYQPLKGTDFTIKFADGKPKYYPAKAGQNF